MMAKGWFKLSRSFNPYADRYLRAINLAAEYYDVTMGEYLVGLLENEYLTPKDLGFLIDK